MCKPARPGSVQTLHNHTETYSRKHISQSENTCNDDLQHVIATVHATCYTTAAGAIVAACGVVVTACCIVAAAYIICHCCRCCCCCMRWWCCYRCICRCMCCCCCCMYGCMYCGCCCMWCCMLFILLLHVLLHIKLPSCVQLPFATVAIVIVAFSTVAAAGVVVAVAYIDVPAALCNS